MHAGQAGLLQGADVGVVVAFRVVAHRTVVLAEGQQGFLEAEAFEDGEAQGLAGTFVLPAGLLTLPLSKALGV